MQSTSQHLFLLELFMFILKHYLSQNFFSFLLPLLIFFWFLFLGNVIILIHFLINPAQQINNNIFTKMWDYYVSLDLIITTKTKQNWITSRGGVVPCSTTFLQNISFDLRKSKKDTRLVEKTVLGRWSLQVSFSITFKLINNFIFPLV